MSYFYFCQNYLPLFRDVFVDFPGTKRIKDFRVWILKTDSDGQELFSRMFVSKLQYFSMHLSVKTSRVTENKGNLFVY